ncbi:MAG TPA: AIM24 family protein [Chloroflexia bacterium]|nr:AIM24 family protein [Chloroflexia bacterium]
MQTVRRIVCEWCQGQNPSESLSCWACGAPLNIRNLISASGWKEAPRIKDMTEIHFGESTCQVEGEIVPVAEMRLAAGDGVYFEHHTLLWLDHQVNLTALPLTGMFKRLMAGMPVIVTVAQGPGRLAFSRDDTGELVVLPLHPGMVLDVREHAFLVASHHIQYSYSRVNGLVSFGGGGTGMYVDRFMTGGETGLLILHGYGNIFERTLAPGEPLLLEPGAFLYKDASVQLNGHFRQIGTGFFGTRTLWFALLTGPGRVGIQSMYVHHAT